MHKELTALRQTDVLTPALVFRDPYLLGFLELDGAFSEKDLESALAAARASIDPRGLSRQLPKRAAFAAGGL